MAADPLDYTDRYNTPLSPSDEAQYQSWAKSLGPQGSTYDYDLRGAFKAGAQQAANGHFTDQFKKPNHPTFSDQSQYSGADGQTGGAWVKQPDGSWTFTPSTSMLKLHDAEDLQQYFKSREPGNKLVLPQKMALSDDQKSQLADLYDEAQKTGDTASAQRIKTALQADAGGGESTLSQVGDFAKQAAQSGGRMLMTAATGVPGVFADGFAGAANVGADAFGAKRPFPVMPSEDFKQRLAPVLGDAPPLASVGGAAEAVGSGLMQPGLAPKVAGAAANSAVDATQAAQRQVLTDAGVRMDAVQAGVGGKAAITARNFANDGPVANTAAFKNGQAEDFTAAALREMGVTDSRAASSGVLRDGRQVLKDTYDAIASRTNISIDAPLNTAMGQIRYAARRALTPDNATVIENQLADIEELAQRNGGNIGGAAYKQLQGALDRVAADGGKAPFVTDIRQALTGAMSRQAAPGDATLLARTDQQYAAMKAIQKAIGPGDQVSPSLLYNALDTAKGANQTVFGQGPNQSLVRLAQAGKAVLKGMETPNSGTGTRSMGAVAITGASVGIEQALQGNFKTAGGLAVAAAAAGISQKTAQGLVYSAAGRKFLQNAAIAAHGAGVAGRAVGTGAARGAVGAATRLGGPDDDSQPSP